MEKNTFDHSGRSKSEPVYLFNPSYEERNADYYNIGLLSIASHLKQKGIPVYLYMNYLDSEVTGLLDYDRILPELLAKPHRFVGISCMTSQMPSALNLTKRIKDISPDSIIVWGGPHVYAFGENLLDSHKEIDYLVRGFGEEAAEGLYRYLDAEAVVDKIPGLIYRREGGIAANGEAPVHQEIYDKPMDHTLITRFKPIDRYFAERPVKGVSIFNTIGCPYRCRFCINSVKHSKIIFRDLDAVVKEIRQVMERGADNIFFIDELFFIKFDRLDRFLDMIEREDLNFSWFAHARVDSIAENKLDEARLRRIRKLGCMELHFGVETGSQKMLDRINKQTKAADLVPALEKVIKASIVPKESFIFGMPDETVEDVKKTIYLIMNIAEKFKGRTILMNYFFYPVPGSPMMEQSFMGVGVDDDVKIKYSIEAARYSGHPYKLFRNFDRTGFYSWIPDKALFAEIWFIARIISDICLPYELRKDYRPRFGEWQLDISEDTYDELAGNCPEDVDRQMVTRWLDAARAYLKEMS